MTRIVVSVPGVTFDNMLFGDGWQLGELEGWWDTTKPRVGSDPRPEWHGDFGQDTAYLEPRFITVSGVFQSRENPDLVTSARDVLAALHEAGEFEFTVSDGAVGRVTARMASELAWDVDYAPGCAAFEFTVKADDPRRYGSGQSFSTGVPTQGVGVADPVVDPVQEGGVLVPVATNLFTNPRLVGDGTWAEVRRNLFPQPCPQTPVNTTYFAGWQGTGNTAAYFSSPDSRFRLGRAVGYRYTVPATASGDLGLKNLPTLVPEGESRIFHYRIGIKLGGVTLQAAFGGAVAGWTYTFLVGGQSAVMAAGETRDVVVKVSRAVGASTNARLGFAIRAGIPAVDEEITMGDILCYSGSHIPGSTPFDGSSLQGSIDPDMRQRWLGAENASESVMEFEMVATKIGDNDPVYLPGLASEAWPVGGTSLRVLGDVPVRVGDQLDPYEPVPLPGVHVSAIQLGDPTTPAWLAGIGSGVMWDTGKIRWTAGQPEAQGSYGAVLRTTGGTNPVSLYGSFKFTGTRFALMMTSWAETDVTVYVDHRAVTPTAYPTLTQGAGHQLVVFEGFGGGVHTVDFCIGWGSNFIQILCEQPGSVEPGPQPAFRLGLLGDSYADSGIQPYYGGLARELHRLTGWSIYQLGQGSTGYTNDGSSSGDTSKSVYGSPSRVAAANGAACDAVLIIGSVNDGAASPATVAQACEDLVNELDAPVIIAGVEPLSLPDDPGTAWNAVNDMLMVMASSLVTLAGGGVIDWRAESWLTGTGSVSQPLGDGNQDLYIGDVAGTDTVHANIEGQMFLADLFVAAMTPMTLVRRVIADAEYANFPGAVTGRTLVLLAESPSQFVIAIGGEPERLHPDGDGIVRVSDAGMVLLSTGRWTDIGLFAGDYDGPAFSGSTPPDTIGGASYTHQWDGGVDASTSARYWVDPGTPGNPGRVALTNTGTAPSEPMVSVTGGLSEGFELLCIETGSVVRVTRPIPDGSVIDIDMGAGQVWIDQQSPLSAMYVPVAEWFSVKPGHTCTIQFTPLGVVTGTPMMTVEFAEASW